VQFHWDREGKFDDGSSIWMRVSQGWAGPSYGMIAIPRVGHEVLVGFLDGDPDNPIVVGRLFNAKSPLPYKLPENKTVSAWKSDSSPGSEGANEIKFEDLKGQELLYVQAEKDLAKLVKNDEVQMVGRDRTRVVERDEVVSVKNDRTKVVQHDEAVSIGNNRTQQVRRDEALAVGGNLSKLVQKDEQESTGQNRSVSVGASRNSKVGINDDAKVGARWSVTMQQGIGAELAKGLGALMDGSALGALLGPALGPVTGMATGLMSPVLGKVQETLMKATPLLNAIQDPLATASQFLPAPLAGVAQAVAEPMAKLLGVMGPPTQIVMVDKKITLTTGKASIILDEGTIYLSAEQDIILQAKNIASFSDEQIALAAKKNLSVISEGGDVLIQGGPMVHINPSASAEEAEETSGESTDDSLRGGGGEDMLLAQVTFQNMDPETAALYAEGWKKLMEDAGRLGTNVHEIATGYKDFVSENWLGIIPGSSDPGYVSEQVWGQRLDALFHTGMQAFLTIRHGAPTAKMLGDAYELQNIPGAMIHGAGAIVAGTSNHNILAESNKDFRNNQVGRNIGLQMLRDNPGIVNLSNDELRQVILRETGKHVMNAPINTTSDYGIVINPNSAPIFRDQNPIVTGILNAWTYGSLKTGVWEGAMRNVRGALGTAWQEVQRGFQQIGPPGTWHWGL
ncbi:MAG TPA: type VI secretion system tip protein TssI/VgrG, partial [Candidatus Nanopelagicales bacterium]|nr:type VI secretion system tip protein TssI/VgrG [Candidatus Nanopelagicales bacterium]